MKINIVGKGIIPGMGVLPPVYNIEKSETDVRRLTNFRNIRVYCSENGLLITKKNVDSFFKTKIDTTTNVVKPKTVDGVERKVLIEQQQQKVSTVEVEDVVTTTDDVIVEEETPTPEEEVVEEIESVIEETIKEDEESEEVVEEETKQPQTYSSKKKNRNKNRK